MFLPPWGVCSWPRLRKNNWPGGVQPFLLLHPAGSSVLSLPLRALQLKGHVAIELSVRAGAWPAPGGTLVGRKEKRVTPQQGWVSWHGVLAVPALLVPLRLSFGLRSVQICQAVLMCRCKTSIIRFSFWRGIFERSRICFHFVLI